MLDTEPLSSIENRKFQIPRHCERGEAISVFRLFFSTGSLAQMPVLFAPAKLWFVQVVGEQPMV